MTSVSRIAEKLTEAQRDVLDLFSAAAGGWSLGMHRAGYRTVAACEAVDWRRALYAENNPGVILYDDVRTLTAERLLGDLGYLPRYVVGSPPCQDISSANTKGKGVEGERSGLYFEAVRIIGEVRPRWFALENSANLRTRGADAVIAALEAIGYTCWAFVVGAGDVGANHERKRSWLIGCDLEQVAHPYDQSDLRRGLHAKMGELQALGGNPVHAESIGHEGGRSRRHGTDGDSTPYSGPSYAPDPHGNPVRLAIVPGRPEQEAAVTGDADPTDGANTVGERPERLAGHPRGEREGEGPERADLLAGSEVGLCPADRDRAGGSRADWSLADLTGHIRLDDGLPAWVAGTRVAVSGPKGTSAASLIVEAFGDAVIPQIPEAIGRAIARTEAALHAVLAA
jgi:DNA (cytosine-5)-methyltransferase 1